MREQTQRGEGRGEGRGQEVGNRGQGVGALQRGALCAHRCVAHHCLEREGEGRWKGSGEPGLGREGVPDDKLGVDALALRLLTHEGEPEGARSAAARPWHIAQCLCSGPCPAAAWSTGASCGALQALEPTSGQPGTGSTPSDLKLTLLDARANDTAAG